MPELPEVEITRRHLESALAGRTMVDVTVSHERSARHNGGARVLEERLTGRKVDTVRRKGKYLTAPLDDGQTMVAHLGMSGRFSVSSPSDQREPHTHVVMRLDDDVEVRFVDPRTFGFIAAFTEEELEASGVGRLGPDAWEEPPGTVSLENALRGRSASIKALLLDQGPISGLGNIYADEVLHLAGIHPLTPAGDLDRDQIAALLGAVRVVLAEAIDSGGTTLEDLTYLLPDGRAGENLERLRVYGREGLPCFRCGTPIERVVVRARSTYFCPECQL